MADKSDDTTEKKKELMTMVMKMTQASVARPME
jgi:hypothetical protein